MKRRKFSAMLLTSPLLCSPWLHSLAADSGNRDMPDIEALQQQWRDFVPEGIEVPSPADRLDLNTSQWRSRLNGERFRILRENGTEPAFSSPLDGETRRGIYLCAGCGLPVFTSAMKYDSGTGWPLFHHHCGRIRYPPGLLHDLAAHRVSLRALRRPSWSYIW